PVPPPSRAAGKTAPSGARSGAMAPRTLLLGLAAAPVGLAKWGTSIRCPGSASFIHASCKLEATAAAGCEDVVDEIKSRVDGQNTVW
ncbi:unnamed protein product, partial [Prorocentrum cordatum]